MNLETPKKKTDTFLSIANFNLLLPDLCLHLTRNVNTFNKLDVRNCDKPCLSVSKGNSRTKQLSSSEDSFPILEFCFFLNQPSYKQVHHNLFITQLFLFYIGVAFFFGKTLRRYFITTTLKYALKLILPDVKTVMTKQSKNLLSLKFVTNGVCKNLSKVRKKLQFSSHLISFHSIERFCIALNSRHD